jgi:hypothetical protein
MKNIFLLLQRKHLLIMLYSLVFLLLLFGVIKVSGWKYVPYLLVYFCSFLLFYSTLYRLNASYKFFNVEGGWLKKMGDRLKTQHFVYASVLCILIHFIFLGNIPTWEAYNAMRLSEVVMIRRNITEHMPTWVNYMMSWNLKALIPFTLAILFVRKDQKWYWIFFPIAVIYAFFMMQKSFILLIMMPVGIIALLMKRWMYVVKYGVIAVTVVFTLSYVQNVTLRGGFNDIRLEYEKQPSAGNLFDRIFGGLTNRVVVVPGKIVVSWFDHVPKDKPFLNGNGYRIIAKVSGGKYHDYARELYPYVYVENAKHGLVGSVNVASFMRGYANFGTVGLVISALFLALILVLIESVFEGHLVFKIAFNAFPILMLSSTSLETNLASGGWLLILTLFLLYKVKLPVLNKLNPAS